MVSFFSVIVEKQIPLLCQTLGQSDIGSDYFSFLKGDHTVFSGIEAMSSIYLFIYLFIYLLIYLFIYFFIYLVS